MEQGGRIVQEAAPSTPGRETGACGHGISRDRRRTCEGEEHLLTVEEFNEPISPEAACRAGTPTTRSRKAIRPGGEP